jgi:hypothetical protein
LTFKHRSKRVLLEAIAQKSSIQWPCIFPYYTGVLHFHTIQGSCFSILYRGLAFLCHFSKVLYTVALHISILCRGLAFLYYTGVYIYIALPCSFLYYIAYISSKYFSPSLHISMYSGLIKPLHSKYFSPSLHTSIYSGLI